jgi:flagellar basal-body rod protein FlgF
MNAALYSAFLGMRARQRALDATASNIANSSTAGFKAERVLYRSIEAAEADTRGPQGNASGANSSTPIATTTDPNETAQAHANVTARAASADARSMGVMTGGATDFSAGSIRETGRTLDVALEGDGFLTVQTARGQRFMRAGNLTLDSAGQLITQHGDLVVGQSGPITIPPGEVSIGADGTISVKGQQIDTLKIVRFNNPQAALVKEGASLFIATGQEKPVEAPNTRVHQGALEMSNVNTVSEMVAMMQNGREFESLQKSVTMMMSDIGRKISSEIGRI